MAPDQKLSEYSDISGQFAEAKLHKLQSSSIEDRNARSAVQFKVLHIISVAFLFWFFTLHAIGIYFFTKGFLLTRLVLDHKSYCSGPSIQISNFEQGSPVSGCWYPKQYSKAIIIIIDALRYDFTVPFHGEPQHFHNSFPILYETAAQSPENAILLPFVADPPTTTLQRLKALTTGTLPTFIDAGSNFAGTAIEEDNILAQLREANKTLVHLGDDTWHSLFPGYFDLNLTHAYDSFNVWDLHTVDNGVTEHIFPLLEKENLEKWDVIFGHYLGVDHAGHRYGPNHPAMAEKLREMNGIIQRLIESVEEQTLVVVMGDHGMDVKGDHGGESDDEVEAALWMYSKKSLFGRSQPAFSVPPRTAKERPVSQIDLVPTISLLLGLPIPFNNLGAPVEEAFIGRGQGVDGLAKVNALAAAQIKKYQFEYSLARGLDEKITSITEPRWNTAMNHWNEMSASNNNNADIASSTALAFLGFQQETLAVCRSLWARFDIRSMIVGIGILICALITLLHFAGQTRAVPGLFSRVLVGGLAGLLFSGAVNFSIPLVPSIDICLLGYTIGGFLGYLSCLWPQALFPTRTPSVSFWAWLAVMFTLSQSIGYASNSYTIWEDEILLFFLSSFAALAAMSSMRQPDAAERFLGLYHSFLFLSLTRLASLSRLCREEQMPICKSTYYASASSSTSATWQLLLPYLLALLLPTIIKSYYQGTKSYEGSAIFWIGFALRIGLLGSALYWTLNAADDGGWLDLDGGILKGTRIFIAQVVLAIAFAAGTSTYIWAAPCLRVETESMSAKSKDNLSMPRSISILGFANVHGSRYFLLFSSWLLAVVLVQKPMGGGAIGLLVWQVLSLLEIIDSNNLAQSAIGPTVLGLLGNYYYFKTGHQATLSSIQWDSAFIALKTIKYPWSPFLVTLNTFGPQILTAIAVPLVVLWKQQPKKHGLLSDAVKATSIHMCYYAVINLATTMWAGWLRRHLMLYRIFSPRFMTGAAALLVVDLIGIVIAVGGLRWNILSVAEVFGWEHT